MDLRHCNATIGQEAGEFGLRPVRCGQSRYVKTFVTSGGLRVGYCPIEGHEASVRRRFAEAQDPPEPEWELPASHEDHSDDPSEGPSILSCPVCMGVDHPADATVESEYAR